MEHPVRFVHLTLGLWFLGGCIDINLPEEGLVGRGAPFVLKREAEAIERNGSCLVWIADNGRTFVLFQDSRVANTLLDDATTPGARSRLELAPRSDLGEPCRAGAIVAEVTKVLEVDGADTSGLFGGN